LFVFGVQLPLVSFRLLINLFLLYCYLSLESCYQFLQASEFTMQGACRGIALRICMGHCPTGTLGYYFLGYFYQPG
jgi:hypothetical protein